MVFALPSTTHQKHPHTDTRSFCKRGPTVADKARSDRATMSDLLGPLCAEQRVGDWIRASPAVRARTLHRSPMPGVGIESKTGSSRALQPWDADVQQLESLSLKNKSRGAVGRCLVVCEGSLGCVRCVLEMPLCALLLWPSPLHPSHPMPPNAMRSRMEQSRAALFRRLSSQ